MKDNIDNKDNNKLSAAGNEISAALELLVLSFLHLFRGDRGGLPLPQHDVDADANAVVGDTTASWLKL